MKTSDRHRVVESLNKLFKHGIKPFEAFHIFVSFRIFCVVWKSELFNGLRAEYGEQHCDKLYQTCKKAAVENVIHYICFLSFCFNLTISAVHSFVNTFVQTVIYVTEILRETVNNL